MLLARASHMAPPNCKVIQKYKPPYAQKAKEDQILVNTSNVCNKWYDLEFNSLLTSTPPVLPKVSEALICVTDIPLFFEISRVVSGSCSELCLYQVCAGSFLSPYLQPISTLLCPAVSQEAILYELHLPDSFSLRFGWVWVTGLTSRRSESRRWEVRIPRLLVNSAPDCGSLILPSVL